VVSTRGTPPLGLWSVPLGDSPAGRGYAGPLMLERLLKQKRHSKRSEPVPEDPHDPAKLGLPSPLIPRVPRTPGAVGGGASPPICTSGALT
jgi:hypothetical protein